MRLHTAGLGLAIVGVLGCGGGAGLSEGDVFRAVDESLVIRIQSETELDFQDSSSSLVGRYSVGNDNQIRIVLNVFGTETVVYARPVDQGLVVNDETVLYDEKHLPEARDRHYCAILEDDVEQLVSRQAERRTVLISGNGAAASHPSRGIERRLTGVSDEWWAVIARLEQCSQAVIYGPETPLLLLERSEAEERFSAWERQAADRATEREREALEQQRRADEAARERLTRLLDAGGPYYGEERSWNGRHPFGLHFTDFDRQSGHFEGRMDYYPEDDRALLALEGRLEGTRIVYELTRELRAGKSKPGFTYTLAASGDALEGQYRQEGSRRTGQIAISLDPGRQQELAREAIRIESHLALLAEARTPTRTLTTVKLDRRDQRARLTDVSIILLDWRSEPSAESAYSFDRIYEVDSFETSGSCNVSFEGPGRGPFGAYARSLYIREKTTCRAFLASFQAAWEAWKERYPSLVPTKRGRR